MSLIKTTFSNRTGTIAFDNYAKRNALSAGLISEVLTTFESFKAKGARVVVLRSATAEKVWSAGHDVDELPKGRRRSAPL